MAPRPALRVARRPVPIRLDPRLFMSIMLQAVCRGNGILVIRQALPVPAEMAMAAGML